MHEQDQGESGTAEFVYPCRPVRVLGPDSRRWRLRLAGAAAVLALLLAALVWGRSHQFLTHLETRLSAEAGGTARLQAMTRQMENLRGKFNGLLAESIEARLKALEKSLETGRIGADELRSFEELQKDLGLLEHSARRGEALGLDYAQREHARFRPVPDGTPVVRNEELLSEVLELKSLLYLCAAGLLATGGATMIGCCWIAGRGKTRYLGAPNKRGPLLSPPTPDDDP